MKIKKQAIKIKFLKSDTITQNTKLYYRREYNKKNQIDKFNLQAKLYKYFLFYSFITLYTYTEFGVFRKSPA